MTLVYFLLFLMMWVLVFVTATILLWILEGTSATVRIIGWLFIG
ncbi:hypothetical protein SM124_02700 [Bacillus sp. 31A1R]|uniref:NADH dehydrogenase subunit 6 n=1 Tax=Robertmurraya mangrovi TaxID=3098077 RepID=A0ABU5IU33_9BACI|nr:hypothetical protein [Bacillus sp. 31A1R]